MATTKHIIIIFALFLFSTQAVISEEVQISNTRQARCNVKIIISDHDVVSLSIGDIAVIIQSPSVLGKTVREILEIAPDEIELLDDIRVSGQNKGNKYTYTSELDIVLPEHIKPAANEFLKALVRNLEKSLTDAFQENGYLFKIQYEAAEKNYKEAEAELNKLFFEEPSIIVIYSEDNLNNNATNKQLETTVDLSKLSQDMSLAEVLEILSKSVDPPLQIQPNWRNLADLPAILPTTPAEIGPLPKVKLRTAIETLLAGLSTSDVPIGYLYHDGVITIATKDSIKVPMVTFVFDISGLLVNGRTSNSLIKAIKETIEPDSWYDENTSAITSVPSETYAGYGGGYIDIPSRNKTGDGKIIDMQGGKISVRNTPEVQNKIMNFLTSFPKELPSEPVESVPANLLIEEKQQLSSQKRMLELDIARLGARQAAAEQQIVGFSIKMQNKASLMVLQQNLAELVSKLAALKTTRTEQNPEVIAVQKQIDEIQKQIKSSQQDTVTSELEQLIENQIKQLDALKKEWEEGVTKGIAPPKPSDKITEAEEKLARTKIELAKRREELARPAGIENLAALNENLYMALLDLAEKKAEFQVLEKQLSEIDSQIKAASTTDPKVQKYRQARKAFEEAEKRLDELKDMKSNMQPPQVITIGLE